jgi:hypothetical protein
MAAIRAVAAGASWPVGFGSPDWLSTCRIRAIAFLLWNLGIFYHRRLGAETEDLGDINETFAYSLGERTRASA